MKTITFITGNPHKLEEAPSLFWKVMGLLSSRYKLILMKSSIMIR